MYVTLSSGTNSPRVIAKSFRIRSSLTPLILPCFGANKSFRIRTYRPRSRNTFRMNRSKNRGRGAPRHIASKKKLAYKRKLSAQAVRKGGDCSGDQTDVDQDHSGAREAGHRFAR